MSTSQAEHFIVFRSSRIHYSRWGTGSRLLFAFHGYGESAASFTFLGDAIGHDFTIVAIDLPFHGETVWNEGFYLSPADLLDLLVSIADDLPSGHPGITPSRQDGWYLLGYSMGGRVALQILELAPDKVRHLVLLAPDGFQMNLWYWLATQTGLGNRLFRRTMKRPGWLFFLLRAGNFLHVANPSIFKFTAHYIDDEPVRENLYARWTTMRGFRPHLRKIGTCIRREAIHLQLIYGSYDRIIRWERGERFRRSNPENCTLTILPAGHQLLQPKFLEIIIKALNLPTI